MPPLASADLDDAQKAVAAELAAGPRGGVVGPFVAALRSPEFASRLQRLGAYLRYENRLGPRLTELAILLTARAWSQAYIWSMHTGPAAAAGVASETIDAIGNGRRPAGMSEGESLVYDFLDELMSTQAVSDTIYERAVDALGEAGVIDLIGLAGYYSTLAMILNVARTPADAR